MLKKHALAKTQGLPAAFPSLGCAHVLPWYPAAWQELSLPTRSGQSYAALPEERGVLAGETVDFLTFLFAQGDSFQVPDSIGSDRMLNFQQFLGAYG